MKFIWKLTADPVGGSTVREVARELSAIMEKNGIDEGEIIHNATRYRVTVQDPFKVEEIKGGPQAR